jgi:hypothetical protein
MAIDQIIARAIGVSHLSKGIETSLRRNVAMSSVNTRLLIRYSRVRLVSTGGRAQLDWQISWLLPVKNPSGIDAGALGEISSVAHQTSCNREITRLGDCGRIGLQARQAVHYDLQSKGPR